MHRMLYGNKITSRTKTMVMQVGLAYVYLCYGINEMFNIVTSFEGQPHAILILTINPTEGLKAMMQRRDMDCVRSAITSRPGSVAKALRINRNRNTLSLQSDSI